MLTAADLADRYLVPLSRLPELQGSIHERSKVTGIGREGLTKRRGIAAVGDSSREGRAFLLRVEVPDGSVRFDRADLVLDASGTYATPNATGVGGLPAAGEDRMGERIERHIPDIAGDARSRYEGRKVLLVGDGHSAATALLWLDGSRPRGRSRRDGSPLGPPRPRGGRRLLRAQGRRPSARRDLLRRANAVARGASWLHRHAGASLVSYEEAPSGRIRATLRLPSGETRAVEVDRVLALVGYRPNLELARELQIHLCYASEAPMNLAAALLTAAVADPGKVGDCLGQASHGAESLKNPEPAFFVIGAKSYGRNPQFLITIGHQQILDALSFAVAPSGAGRTMVGT